MLNETIAALESGKATVANLQELQNTVDALGDTYATDAELSSAIAGVQSAIDNIDLSDYVKSTDLAPVATSGQYSDLQGLPEIPSADDFATSEQVNAIQSALADKANVADLAAVATSGSYNDLINIPTDLINQSGLDDVVADLQALIDAKQDKADGALKSELQALAQDVENLRSGSSVTSADLNALTQRVVAIEGAYATDADVADVIADVASNLEYITANATAIQDINAELDGLATVATTGSYNDLLDKPTLITQDDLTTLRTALETEIAKKQVAGEYATAEDLIAVSDTLAELQGNSYTRAEVDQKITDAITNGTVDLTGYATVEALNNVKKDLAAKDTELSEGLAALTNSLTDYVKRSELAAVATSGSYNDLTDKPDLTQYVTNETLEQNNYVTNETLEQKNYVTNDLLEQQNYVTNAVLEEKKYLTEEKAANTYLTTADAESTYLTEAKAAETYLTEENVNNFVDIPDGSVTAAKLADGAVTAEKINTGTDNAGEMMMLMSNGDGTSQWVVITVDE